ncbi:hypothetical protein BGW37DRAFT_432209 [Umbelopsis sp. PMI_123]|nr:hypothetical protein BGW37DRAFT_432209 [Umbelopsis sp. PMI_123]
MSQLLQYISTKIYQYVILTALYVLEPWEKALFHAIILVILSLSNEDNLPVYPIYA